MRAIARLVVFLVAGLLIGCGQDDKVVIPTSVPPMPTEPPRAMGELPVAPTTGAPTSVEK